MKLDDMASVSDLESQKDALSFKGGQTSRMSHHYFPEESIEEEAKSQVSSDGRL